MGEYIYAATATSNLLPKNNFTHINVILNFNKQLSNMALVIAADVPDTIRRIVMLAVTSKDTSWTTSFEKRTLVYDVSIF